MKIRTILAVAALATVPRTLVACSDSNSPAAAEDAAADTGSPSCGACAPPGPGPDATAPPDAASPQDSGSDGHPDATASPDSSGATDAASEEAASDGGSDGGGPVNSGDVIVSGSSTAGASTVTLTSVGAAFLAGVTPVQSNIVLTTDAGGGACQVVQENLPAQSGGGTPVSAGTITITGASEPLTLTATVAQQADGGSDVSYNDLVTTQLDGGTVTPGASLTVSAAGATVPAFTAMVTEPGVVTLTAPDLVDAATFTVTRSTPIALTWTGGGSTGSFAVLISQFGTTTATSVGCTFPESAGSGSIPAAALSYLMPSNGADGGPTGSSTSISFSTFSSKQVAVSDWTISVLVETALEVGVGTVVTVQ